MTQSILVTVAGKTKLQVELKHIRSVERPNTLQMLEKAREQGDLSENADYHAAKEHLAYLQARISQIEDQLSRLEVVDIKKMVGDKIVFGAKVTLDDVDNDKEEIYVLTGEIEADPHTCKISLGSPIGRALLGKKVGDDVEVKTPRGIRNYEVLDITFDYDYDAIK